MVPHDSNLCVFVRSSYLDMGEGGYHLVLNIGYGCHFSDYTTLSKSLLCWKLCLGDSPCGTDEVRRLVRKSTWQGADVQQEAGSLVLHPQGN